MVRVDHLAHPGRFAAEISIIGAGARAGGNEFAAVELVRADGGQHNAGAAAQRIEAARIVGIGHHQRRFGGCADQAAHLLQLS